MIHWCASCRVHMVLTPNAECPVCDERPPAPVVVPRLQLDPLPAVGPVAADEQAGGARP